MRVWKFSYVIIHFSQALHRAVVALTLTVRIYS